MRLLRYVLPFLVVATATVHAQSSSDWYLNKPIEAIEFDGLETVRNNELTPVTDPFVGREFTEPTFLELQRRLYALDYFEQIIPNAVRPADGSEDRVILRFEVRERPVISQVEFSGNNRLGRNRLLDVVLLTEGDMVTRSKLRVDEEAIRSLYLEQGYPDVEVSSEFIEGDEDNIVRFTIVEGRQISIETIEFFGNQFASDSTLRSVIQLRPRNIFNKGLFQATTLETDRQRIQRYYYEEGYVDAEVVEVEQTLREDAEDDRSYMTLGFFIDEGEQYTYGGISFSGNTIFSDEELSELVRLTEGETLNLNAFDAGYQRIADRYYENGYIFNQITRQEIRDEQENSISFEVRIVERNRAHIENIIIRGNEKTQDYVIEREIPLEVGDVFSATKIREGLRNLANLQFFSSVAPETPPGSAEGLMDLIINLEEANTAEIVFGVAFGGNQEFPVSAQVQWQDRNFLGRGQTFGIQATASPINQQVSFNFLERWLLGRRWSGGVNLSFERSVVNNVPQDVIPPIYPDGSDDAMPDPFAADEYAFTGDTDVDGDGTTDFGAGDRFPGQPTPEQISEFDLRQVYDGSTSSIPDEYLMSYDAYSIGLSASTGYTFRTPFGSFVPRTSIGTSINLITYDDTLYRPANSTTRENLDRWRFRNRWSLGAALDNRDFVYSPSSGYRLDQGLTFVGGALGGERHFIRTDSTAETYFTLWDIPLGDWSWKGVLGMQTRLSMIWPNFYLADDNSRYFSVAGTDLLRIDGMFNSRGWPFETDGASLWNNWIELRMPLSEQVIWWDTFFEAATLQTFSADAADWRDRERLNDITLQDWQFSVGTGVRFVIPQFPIRLYLAKRFAYDENGDIEWQTGNLFNNGDLNSGRGIDLVFTIGAEFF
jgi:outer membrane protein insertion porin family